MAALYLTSAIISKRITLEQKSHSASLIPFWVFDTGKVRRHSEHVTAIVPLSFFTHTAALLGLPTRGRVGSSCSNSTIFSNNCGGWYSPLEKNASASTLSGTDKPENSPEIAITGII